MISLYVFPLSVAILTPLCCFLPYALAVYYGQVNWWLPFISDTGGVLPQSSLFSQLLDINAIMISFTAFIRYKQLKVQFRAPDSKLADSRLELLNPISLYLTYLGSFGVLIIGNYRMTELILGHGVGVFLAFGSLAVYFLLMAFISLRTATDKKGKNLARWRYAITLMTFLFMALMVLFTSLSVWATSVSTFLDNDFRRHWSHDQPGYWWHCLGDLFEWLAVLTLTPYFATFIVDFRPLSWKDLRPSTSSVDTNANQVV